MRDSNDHLEVFLFVKRRNSQHALSCLVIDWVRTIIFSVKEQVRRYEWIKEDDRVELDIYEKRASGKILEVIQNMSN
ncbi:hypothetical protein CW755_09245 [Geobacillus thermodenitrificans]|jgi:hypothetical protein|nr:hypothetical protein GD3902_05225 [Geobacillus thermodenitrificans]KQB94379.1 hypothetical protein GEPA3_0739 [Geobacillus sp. PA-3]OQP11459.1 hypothetical protein B1691_01710 [Geobacillus sp. 47C-IIb]ARP41780.1 hypothetical protein GTHT12_00215 [Geobacillus thermodenitrificans]ATO36842.1 hypothetical protein GTID1_06110 [Geobacillus thermodenitrificans]